MPSEISQSQEKQYWITETESKMVVAMGEKEGEWAIYCLEWAVFQFCKIKRVLWTDDGDAGKIKM